MAGSDTTAYTIACTTYYLLMHKGPLAKLKEELKLLPRTSNGRLDLKNVMALPYLVSTSSALPFKLSFPFLVFAREPRLTKPKTAVIKEGLRLSSGIPGILPRVVPPQGALVKNKFIPGGVRAPQETPHRIRFTLALARTDPLFLTQTIVSISTRIIHDNPSLFPKPASFSPDRWLGEKGKELERWNVSFSKGPRQCIGIK